MKIGHGYDVHRFDESRKLILGGIKIPSHAGLLGHSDADVLTHAVMDALLGAAGLRDIGFYFPPTDEKYKDANSMELLAVTTELIKNAGYRVVNIDCTVIAQMPKLSPYIESIRDSLASALNCSYGDVNVKATTEEGLGFTGQKLGMAAHCVCLLESI